MQINQLNIMKLNVIKYLLKSSESSGPSMDRHLPESERISGREVNRISRNVRSNLLQSESPTEKNRQNEYRQIWKKVDVRKMFWKRGEVKGGDLTFCGFGQVWWVTMCVTNRALPCSMSNDILRIVLCRGLVRRVVSLPKESLGKLVTDFFKTFKIVDFRRDFWH